MKKSCHWCCFLFILKIYKSNCIYCILFCWWNEKQTAENQQQYRATAKYKQVINHSGWQVGICHFPITNQPAANILLGGGLGFNHGRMLFNPTTMTDRPLWPWLCPVMYRPSFNAPFFSRSYCLFRLFRGHHISANRFSSYGKGQIVGGGHVIMQRKGQKPMNIFNHPKDTYVIGMENT